MAAAGMSTINDRMRDPKYKEWLKAILGQKHVCVELCTHRRCSTGLQCVKKALEKPVHTGVEKLHEKLEGDLRKGHQDSWVKERFNELLKKKNGGKIERPCWANWKPAESLDKPWEIAKVFMLPGCEECHSPEESDISALLDVMIKATIFSVQYKYDITTIINVGLDVY